MSWTCLGVASMGLFVPIGPGVWLVYAALALLLAHGSPSIAAAEATLPEKSTPSAAASVEPKVPSVSNDSREPRSRSCWHDLTSTPTGLLSYTPGDELLYLARREPIAVKGGGLPKSNYTLYNIDLRNMTARPILATSMPYSTFLVTHGEPPEAITLVGFDGKTTCGEGGARLLEMRLDPKQRGAIRREGNFGMVSSGDREFLVELGQNVILESDHGSSQSRIVSSVPAGERALFFKSGSNQLVTLAMLGDRRELRAYAGGRTSPTLRLEIPEGARVLQKWDLFGYARGDAQRNAILLTEIAPWSGSKRDTSYQIDLPPQVGSSGFDSAAIEVHFVARRAAVYGSDIVHRRRWRQVAVFAYDKSSRPIAIREIPDRSFAEVVAIDPSGRFVIVDQKSVRTGSLEKMSVYSFASGAWQDIKFLAPKAPATLQVDLGGDER